MGAFWKKWLKILGAIFLIYLVVAIPATSQEDSRPMFKLLNHPQPVSLKYRLTPQPNFAPMTVDVEVSEGSATLVVSDGKKKYIKHYTLGKDTLAPFIVNRSDIISKVGDWKVVKEEIKYTLMDIGLSKDVLNFRRYVELLGGFYHGDNRLIGCRYDYDYESGILLKTVCGYFDPIVADTISKSPDTGPYDFFTMELISSSYPLGKINRAMILLDILLVMAPFLGIALIILMFLDWRKMRDASEA